MEYAWMDATKLKLNPVKTEVIVFGSKTMQDKIEPLLWQIPQEDCHTADVVRNLGILFDGEPCFKHQIVSVCKSCFIGLWDLRRIRRHLTKAAAITIANALVSSKLNNCNSLYCSAAKEAKKLQLVQNALACVVTGASKWTHVTHSMKALHWLPARQQTAFNTAAFLLISIYILVSVPLYEQ